MKQLAYHRTLPVNDALNIPNLACDLHRVWNNLQSLRLGLALPTSPSYAVKLRLQFSLPIKKLAHK